MLHTHGEGRLETGALAAWIHQNIQNSSKRYEEQPSPSLAPDSHVGSVWESTRTGPTLHQQFLQPPDRTESMHLGMFRDPRGDAVNTSCALQSSAPQGLRRGPTPGARGGHQETKMRRHRAQLGPQLVGPTIPQQVRLQTSQFQGLHHSSLCSLFLLHWQCPP